jgi:hypothetical protein
VQLLAKWAIANDCEARRHGPAQLSEGLYRKHGRLNRNQSPDPQHDRNADWTLPSGDDPVARQAIRQHVSHIGAIEAPGYGRRGRITSEGDSGVPDCFAGSVVQHQQ